MRSNNDVFGRAMAEEVVFRDERASVRFHHLSVFTADEFKFQFCDRQRLCSAAKPHATLKSCCGTNSTKFLFRVADGLMMHMALQDTCNVTAQSLTLHAHTVRAIAAFCLLQKFRSPRKTHNPSTSLLRAALMSSWLFNGLLGKTPPQNPNAVQHASGIPITKHVRC